jgi:hypothetical protein
MGREGRRPGRLPPLRRFIQAPLEWIILEMAGWQILARVAIKFLSITR